jgi:hypothetical protein
MRKDGGKPTIANRSIIKWGKSYLAT